MLYYIFSVYSCIKLPILIVNGKEKENDHGKSNSHGNVRRLFAFKLASMLFHYSLLTLLRIK